MPRHAILALTILTGCESAVPITTQQDSTGPGTTSTSTGADVSPTTTSALPDPATTTTGPAPASTTTGTDTGSDPTYTDCSFLCDPGDVGLAFECSPWDQDCPPGMKCRAWSHELSWDWLSCFPVDPNPDAVGEPCTVEGSGVSGIDSCDIGAMCWDVDPPTNVGTCVPLCIGSEAAPACADPTRHCAVAYGGIITLCLQKCDPLASTPCPAAHGCYPIDGAFICAPDASQEGGAQLEPCEFINACQSGLVCGDPAQVGDLCGPDAPGCCTPPCSLDDPACPETTTCIPFFDEGAVPPDYTNLGICAQSPG